MSNTHFKLFAFPFSIVAATQPNLIGEAKGAAPVKHKIAYMSPPGKYLQRVAVDIGDVPGHQLAVYDIQYKFESDAPVYDGVKVAEMLVRGASDVIDGSGSSTLYAVNRLENGDMIFSQNNMVLKATVNPDGSTQAQFNTVGKITGGTGKFKGIRGVTHSVGTTDFKTGVNLQQNEVEYWFEN